MTGSRMQQGRDDLSRQDQLIASRQEGNARGEGLFHRICAQRNNDLALLHTQDVQQFHIEQIRMSQTIPSLELPAGRSLSWTNQSDLRTLVFQSAVPVATAGCKSIPPLSSFVDRRWRTRQDAETGTSARAAIK